MSKKIACLFPGIGYTCDKPLLYDSAPHLADTSAKMEKVLIPIWQTQMPDSDELRKALPDVEELRKLLDSHPEE